MPQKISLPQLRSHFAVRQRWALFTLCLAVLIAQVDTSVVNLAVHPIRVHFAVPVSVMQWVLDSYNLAYATLLLTGGLLADLFGRRRIFMTGALLFAVASLLCGAAPSIGLLIAGRGLAGVGAALMMPASLALIRVVWPDPIRRGRALGVWAACNGLALAVGPTIGGFVIADLDWRGIFFLVVPLALGALGLAPLSLPASADPADRYLDLPAQMLGIVVLGALAMSAINIDRQPVMAVAALVLSLVALGGFLARERRAGSRAMIPPDLFRLRPFRGAITATAAMTFGMYGALFLVPLLWQGNGALSPVRAGLGLIPMALVFVLVSPLSGRLTERLGARILTAGGLALIALGLIITGVAALRGTFPATLLGLAMTGAGMGLATGPLFGLAVGAVSAARSGTAAALINVARMVGATLGVALLGTVFSLCGGGASGVRTAMVLAAMLQLSAAGYLLRAVPSAARSPAVAAPDSR